MAANHTMRYYDEEAHQSTFRDKNQFHANNYDN